MELRGELRVPLRASRSTVSRAATKREFGWLSMGCSAPGKSNKTKLRQNDTMPSSALGSVIGQGSPRMKKMANGRRRRLALRGEMGRRRGQQLQGRRGFRKSIWWMVTRCFSGEDTMGFTHKLCEMRTIFVSPSLTRRRFGHLFLSLIVIQISCLYTPQPAKAVVSANARGAMISRGDK